MIPVVAAMANPTASRAIAAHQIGAAHRHITAKGFDFRRYGNISRAILVQPRITVQNQCGGEGDS
jgi:hypothetical protein